MLINSAWASAETAPVATTSTSSTDGAPGAPNPTEAMLMNVGLVLVLVALFYLLLIRPQQKRFKDHAAMLGKLDKGSKIVTQGGIVGTIEKDVSEHEVLIDCGANVKMTVMRSAIMGRYEDAIPKSKDTPKK